MFQKYTVSLLLTFLLTTASPANASPQYAEDRAEIENVMSAYLWAFDTLNEREFGKYFTTNGELVLTGDGFPTITFKGDTELSQFIAAVRERNHIEPSTDPEHFSPNIHFYSNLVLSIHGASATGTSYWFTVRRGENHDIVGEPNPNPSHFVSTGYYEDHFAKINGHWLIQRRVIHEMHPSMTGSSTNDATKPPAQ